MLLNCVSNCLYTETWWSGYVFKNGFRMKHTNYETNRLIYQFFWNISWALKNLFLKEYMCKIYTPVYGNSLQYVVIYKFYNEWCISTSITSKGAYFCFAWTKMTSLKKFHTINMLEKFYSKVKFYIFKSINFVSFFSEKFVPLI